MHRQSATTYTASAPNQSRYPATSSAFSASANPNEDWTKISDLAERRRIQNRIAQRNYRKKLKKRLEDLERRAASNSASPEQQPAELQDHNPQRHHHHHQQQQQHPQQVILPEVSRSSADYSRLQHQTPETNHSGYLSLPDDRMFSHQYTRQISTSPPPTFPYPTLPSETVSYPPFTSSAIPYSTAMTPSCSDMTLFPPQYLPPLSSSYPSPLPSVVYPIKQDLYADDDISQFNLSYGPIAGLDITAAQSYSEVVPQTPPLTDCLDRCCVGSPPDSGTFPRTPATYPPSPPLTML